MEQGQQTELIADFVNRRVWAVVGASQDPYKFGYQVSQTLREAGYTVYPVNPKGGTLEGARIYRNLAELPQSPDVVDLVIPPPVTEQIVREAHRLGLVRIWLQPGAESEDAIQYCRENGMQVVYDACAMVHARSWA